MTMCPGPHHTLTQPNQKLETEPMTAGPTPKLLLKGQTKAGKALSSSPRWQWESTFSHLQAN